MQTLVQLTQAAEITGSLSSILASLAASIDLRAYDIIVINTSAGKDSEVMQDLVWRLAVAQGVSDRVVSVHCDLGVRVEWDGTKELAERQTARYGMPFFIVSRRQGDLLAQAEFERKMWPGPKTSRWCTSDQKRDQVLPLITRLVTEYNERHQAGVKVKSRRQVKVLNCIGIRAQESDERAAKGAFVPGWNAVEGKYERGSSSVRVIDNWHPVHALTEEQIWAHIRTEGLEYHYAYDIGMPRLSCVFCIYAPPQALLLAGYHNRSKLAAYTAAEQRMGHSFKQGLSLIQIEKQLEAGYVPPAGKISSNAWEERCAA